MQDLKDEEKVEETCKCEEETEEKVEETCDCEEETEEKTNYKVYGKEKTDDAREMAEKMINDVISSIKSKQKDLNKSFEEYTANKPPVDVVEYEENIVINMDIPRVSKDDVSVNITPENVEIIVEFPDLYTEDEDVVKVLRKERCIGKTKNVIPIPVEVQTDKVKASFEDSQLTITLPKVQPKKVEVEIV